MTRPRPTRPVDWRPVTLVLVLYATFLVVAVVNVVLPAMRALLEASF